MASDAILVKVDRAEGEQKKDRTRREDAEEGKEETWDYTMNTG